MQYGVAAFSEIASVITVTILLIHISLMISHYDMLWFVVHWNFVSHVMPQMFLIIGSFCLIFGCCLGSLLLADKVTGGIVIFVAGIVTIVLVVNWLFMLDRNKKHQIKSIEKFRKILKEQLKIHMQKEHGQMK